MSADKLENVENIESSISLDTVRVFLLFPVSFRSKTTRSRKNHCKSSNSNSRINSVRIDNFSRYFFVSIMKLDYRHFSKLPNVLADYIVDRF